MNNWWIYFDFIFNFLKQNKKYFIKIEYKFFNYLINYILIDLLYEIVYPLCKIIQIINFKVLFI